MKIAHILLGIIISIFITTIGAFLYVQFIAKMNFFQDLSFLIENEFGGKIIAIGSLLNIPIVYFLLNKQKIDIGKGVITGLFVLVIVSQLI